MPLSTAELADARENTSGLLDELGLAAYLFEVQPQDTQWEIRVECAIVDGWESFKVVVPKEILLKSRDDPAARQEVVRRLRDRISACKVRVPTE